MTSENFCYWLQGWFELNETIDHRDGATKETLEMIKSHLQLVFKKVTPSTGTVVDPTEKEKILLERIKKGFEEQNKKVPFPPFEDKTYC